MENNVLPHPIQIKSMIKKEEETILLKKILSDIIWVEAMRCERMKSKSKKSVVWSQCDKRHKSIPPLYFEATTEGNKEIFVLFTAFG